MGKEQIKDMYGEQIGNTIENKKLWSSPLHAKNKKNWVSIYSYRLTSLDTH